MQFCDHFCFVNLTSISLAYDFLQMPIKSTMKPKFVKSEDSDDQDSEEEVGSAGQWAQGLSKGVFAHKRSAGTGVKRQLKSPGKKTNRCFST